MDGTSFINELKNGPEMEPEENVFGGVWAEYERVILHSLVTSFGLDFLVSDQHGGDVDTVHNVRNNVEYKNLKNKAEYEGLGEYTKTLQAQYHGGDDNYIKINARYSKQKKDGTLIDGYTGKKVARNAKIDLDHTISTKEIHEDPGRVLAGLKVEELANAEWNLTPTERTINRSMKDDDKDLYLQKHENRTDQRNSRIEELRSREALI